jgi:hypothetical protein
MEMRRVVAISIVIAFIIVAALTWWSSLQPYLTSR